MIGMKILFFLSTLSLMNLPSHSSKDALNQSLFFSSSCFYLMVQLPSFDVNGKGLPLLFKVFSIIILFHWGSVFSIDLN